MEYTDENGRRVIRRAWHNTDADLHRTTGPAWEQWVVLPGGGHVLWHQAWYLNGKLHREGRPAIRVWHIAENGDRVLEYEEWLRHGGGHRGRGPSYRHWAVGPDGTRTLTRERWYVRDKLHRVDGPALNGNSFYWHGRIVEAGDLPWLRRGCGLLVGFTGAPAGHQSGNGGTSPAWSLDTRVAMTNADSASSTSRTYRSAVGGAVLLCV